MTKKLIITTNYTFGGYQVSWGTTDHSFNTEDSNVLQYKDLDIDLKTFESLMNEYAVARPYCLFY